MLERGVIDGAAWLAQMRSQAEPLRVSQRGAFTACAEHVRAATLDPELFALVAVTRGATPAQQTRALFALLAASRAGASAEARAIADRVIALLLARLPDDDVITVFIALRRARANHKHAARAIVRWVLDHPRAESLIARRRPALRDAIEHALGRNVARACAKHLAERTPAGDAYVARTLHKYTRIGDARLATLYAAPAALVPAQYQPATPLDPEPELAYPKTVTATNRGDIAATLVHLYRGGDSDALRRGLAEYVERAAGTLPAFAGRIALVVDASLSTLGYGERQYCCISQSWALALVLRARCPELAIHVAGGRAEPPVPEGATDLVTPLLDALAGDPDVVAIVTDGYENRLGGELERVIAALPRAGVTTPVIIVNSKFTHKDDLALRRPTKTLSIDMWHEHDFVTVLETIGAAARNDVGRNFLTRALAVRLSALENQSWTLQSNASP